MIPMFKDLGLSIRDLGLGCWICKDVGLGILGCTGLEIWDSGSGLDL